MILLIKVTITIYFSEPVPTPRECCEASNIPEFCIGICIAADAMTRQEKRLSACSKYETIAEKCFQASEGGLQGDIVFLIFYHMSL